MAAAACWCASRSPARKSRRGCRQPSPVRQPGRGRQRQRPRPPRSADAARCRSRGPRRQRRRSRSRNCRARRRARRSGCQAAIRRSQAGSRASGPGGRTRCRPGIEAAIVAVIWIAIGSVLRALSTASAWPISALITVWPAVTEFISARQQNSSQTLRFIQKWLQPPRAKFIGLPSRPRTMTSGGPARKVPIRVTGMPASRPRGMASSSS